MLMTEHKGSEKFATFLETFPLFMEHSIVSGKAAEEDFEKNAVNRAG